MRVTPSGATASATALATAAKAPIVPPSPTPFEPSAVRGLGDSMCSSVISAGMSVASGTR